MDVRPIKTEEDYEWALAELVRYFDRQPDVGSADGDRFDVLSELVAAYEARHFALPEVDPVEALKAFMGDAGKSQSDLAVLLGSRSRASEILNRKRVLTVEMIFTINEAWGLPAELLVRPYKLAA